MNLDLSRRGRRIEVVRDGSHGAYESKDGDRKGEQGIGPVYKGMHLSLNRSRIGDC